MKLVWERLANPCWLTQTLLPELRQKSTLGTVSSVKTVLEGSPSSNQLPWEDRSSRAHILSCLALPPCARLVSSAQLFASPSPVAHQSSLPRRFTRKEYWSGLPCPPPGDLLNPGIKPVSLAWQTDSLPMSNQGNVFVNILKQLINLILYHSQKHNLKLIRILT